MNEAFARILQRTMGLDPASVGISTVERAVQKRMDETSAAGEADYLNRVQSDPVELQALVESVVVPETWFFRDPKAFELVVDEVKAGWQKENFRFLCFPSSTGEEPYSLAMALLDAGVRPQRFQIDAADISERVIDFARHGIYGRNSFRGKELTFRERYFEQTEGGHLLSPAVREKVTFHHQNLLEAAHGRSLRGPYDAIFCRNLLIYFDRETQDRAIRTLEAMLAPNGLFCVAPAETGLLATYDFTHTRIALTFAFRKGKEEAKPIAPRPQPAAKAALKALPPRPIMKWPAPTPASRQQAAAVAKPLLENPALPNLREALRLADEGRFAEAEPICLAFIQQAPPTAEAYYLLGLVRDSEARFEEAANLYRKALYLDPRHHDTLLHYSLLAAKQGDKRSAEALRDRARRSASSSTP